MNAEKKNGKRIFLCLFSILLIICAILTGIFLYIRSTGKFIKNTTLNGFDISEKTPEEVLTILEDEFNQKHVILTENKKRDFKYSFEELGLFIEKDLTLSLIQDALAIQNKNPYEILKSYTKGRSIQMDILTGVNEKLFCEKVNAKNLKEKRILNQNAYIQQDKDGNYEIVPEVYGTEFKDSDLQHELLSQIGKYFLNAGEPDGIFSKKKLKLAFPTELYQSPEILSTDEEMNRICNAYNQYCQAKIIFQFGSQTEIIDWETIKDWLILDGNQVWLNEELIRNFVEELSVKYNTRYHERSFLTTYGNSITFSGGQNEYGYTINQDAEYARLIEDLQSNTVVTREPVYIERNDYDNPLYFQREGKDDLAGTYVEVNLSAQHLWFYKYGALIMESDFVSGCVSKKHETQTGVFPLAYKKSPDVLVGSNANDGYRTKVEYWMPFYEGQGLHDATWRSSFGGSIYKNNGSHGCVNLPLWAAAEIYQNIEPGTAIIVYK